MCNDCWKGEYPQFNQEIADRWIELQKSRNKVAKAEERIICVNFLSLVLIILLLVIIIPGVINTYARVDMEQAH